MQGDPSRDGHFCDHGTNHRSGNAERGLDALAGFVSFGTDSFRNAASADLIILAGPCPLSELSVLSVFGGASIF